MKRVWGGYLTVSMALCLGVLLPLFLTLIEGARRNGGALEASCAADIGVQSVMAEYHRQLLEQYNLFAIDASYGTAFCGSDQTEAHLLRYLEKNVSAEDLPLSRFFYRDFLGLSVDGVEMTGMSILTDDGGAVFRRRAAEAMEDEVMLSGLEQLKEWAQVIQINGLETTSVREEKAALDGQLEEYEYEDEEGQIQVGVENPTAVLEQKRGLGILRLVLEDESRVSQNTIDLSGLVYSRMRQGKVSRGNLPLSEGKWTDELAQRFLFQKYLLKYMGRYGAEGEGDALRYQVEYLLSGQENDTENLKNVANRLCGLREAANAAYLLSDVQKCTEALAAAELISGLLLVPEIAPVLQGAILLGWAYAESVYDVKVLLSGGKVPLLKDSASWHCDLESALSGNTGGPVAQGKGLSYEDYLCVFLWMAPLEELTGRAMDMVEADIRLTPGNERFRLDGCYDRVEFDIRMSSSFGYSYELTRGGSYGANRE